MSKIKKKMQGTDLSRLVSNEFDENRSRYDWIEKSINRCQQQFVSFEVSSGKCKPNFL